MKANLLIPVVIAAPVVFVAAGCGASKHGSSNPATTTAPTATTTTHTTTRTSTSPGALQAEAASAATGDIPDSQVFLRYRSAGGWSIKYPEGWAQSGGANTIVFRDKNNIVRVVIRRGSAPTTAQVRNDGSLRAAHITSGPSLITTKGKPVVKVVYTTRSAPNPVTGKRVTLTVDRYYAAAAGKVATIDLGTPVGVDNVDAYRLMIESFRWK